MSISASLLILAVVVIRALAIHKLPKATFLALWGVAVCRLLIPFTIESPASIFSIFDKLPGFSPKQPSGSITSFITLPQPATIHPLINPIEQNFAAVTFYPAFIVWIIGLTACALFFVITHIKYSREFKASLPIDNSFILEWQRTHKLMRTVQIRQFDRINAPLTYGILRPVILLPKTMNMADEKQLEYVLIHEFTHIKRFDALWKWLLAASLSIHWFNPMVWVMYVLANRDIELFCDEAVIHKSGATQKSSYALTLISMEEKRSITAPLCNNFSKNAIEERIIAIMKLKKPSIIGITAALIIIIGVTVIFVTTSPRSNAHTISAVPVSLTPIEGQVTGNGNILVAAPKNAANEKIDISDLNLNFSVLNISQANDIFESITGDGYQNITVKFKQDMDASTLNAQNILVFVGKNAAEFSFNYDAKSKTLNIEITRNPPSNPAENIPGRIIFTSNIKTADGKFIGHNFVCQYN
jgi:beta-lactamase regulating signal transducer with metallopeptidase domain